MKLTGNLVYPHEYDILVEMDAAYCDESNKEVQARNQIMIDRKNREAELNSRGRR